MLKNITWISVPLFLFAAVIAQGEAQVSNDAGHKEWEASFFAGFSAASDQTSLTPVEGQSSARPVGLDYKSGFLLGGRITQNLGSHFGAELEYSFADQPLDFIDLTPTLPNLKVDHNIHSIIYSVLVYPFDRSKRLRPYGTIGGGTSLFYIGTDSKNNAAAQGVVLKDSWKFAFSFGGGIKYLITNKLGVRADVRDQMTGVPDYGLPDVSPLLQNGGIGPAFRNAGTLHNLIVNVGLSYSWDAR